MFKREGITSLHRVTWKNSESEVEWLSMNRLITLVQVVTAKDRRCCAEKCYTNICYIDDHATGDVMDSHRRNKCRYRAIE